MFANMSERPSDTNPLRVRFYGPVHWDSAISTTPLTVERHAWNSPSDSDWVDVTCAFSQAMDMDPANNNTVIILTPIVSPPQFPTRPLQRGFEYRVRPTESGSTTVLRSDVPHKSLADDPPVSTANPLRFKVCVSAAVGDADDNGTVNFADVTSVLANFGTNLCMTYGDADRNGMVNFADVTAVLANWLAGGAAYCPEAGQSIGSSADGFAQMDLDRSDAPTSLAEAVMTITDALNQMGYASIDAFGDAIARMDEETRNAEIRRLGELLEGVTQE